MLSVSPQGLVIVEVLLLFLVVLGSSKLASMAREVVHFLGGARRTVEDVKSELIPEEIGEARRAIKDSKTEALYGAEQDKRRRKAVAAAGIGLARRPRWRSAAAWMSVGFTVTVCLSRVTGSRGPGDEQEGKQPRSEAWSREMTIRS
jgi:Sec-independent protein translocase protein TatA